MSKPGDAPSDHDAAPAGADDDLDAALRRLRGVVVRRVGSLTAPAPETRQSQVGFWRRLFGGRER